MIGILRTVAAPKKTIWKLEPHTKAKHDILRKYLQAWFPILSSWRRRVVYYDGFAGPGRYEGGEAGSPLIAIEVAKDHRAKLTSDLRPVPDEPIRRVPVTFGVINVWV